MYVFDLSEFAECVKHVVLLTLLVNVDYYNYPALDCYIVNKI